MPRLIASSQIWAAIILTMLAHFCEGYSSAMSMTGASSVVSDYNTNLGYCQCDVTPNLCDNYCCCDGSCSSSAWSDTYSCKVSGESVEKFCNESSILNFDDFEDLACVFYSSRGEIGDFYSQIATVSSTGTGTFFGKQFENKESLINLASSSVPSAGLASAYNSQYQYLKRKISGANNYFYSLGGVMGSCGPRLVNITEDRVESCQIGVTAQNCVNLNDWIASSFGICTSGDCVSVSSHSETAPTLSGTTCSGVITSLSLSFTISSSGSSYTLSSLTYSTIPSSLTTGSIATVSTAITVSKAAAISGNPGYQVGKALTVNSNGSAYVLQLADSSNNCYLTTDSPTSSTSIRFGEDLSVGCLVTTPCLNSYNIDEIAKQATLQIQQYASKSTAAISVEGTGTAVNSCNDEQISLDIIYTYDGWDLAPQYYVVGAKLSSSPSPSGSTPTRKYFRVRWLYQQPSLISTPPTNTFNEYFSKVWLPLRQKFGLSS